MIKLLMGITLSEVGGSQRVVFSIISNLPDKIYDITLVTSPGGELLDWIYELNKNRANKIKVITLTCLRRDISPFWDLLTFIKLLSLLKQNKYDVAHFHNSKMGILGRIAAKIQRLPKIYYTVHGWGLNKKTVGSIFPILNSIEKIVTYFTTKIVFVSKKDFEDGIKNGWAYPLRSCLIYNGVSDKSCITNFSCNRLELPDNIPIIAFVARLSEPKDPLFLIQVSEWLIRNGCHHMLIIVGDGPMLQNCRNLIYTLGIEKNVLLLGKRYDIFDLLNKADIFCLFSKWEGLPISIIEAMLCGLPVVANDVGGIPELIIHGKTGYLLHELNVNQAAILLADLIRDKEKRIRFGNEAKKIAYKNFDLTNMVAKYRRLYEE